MSADKKLIDELERQLSALADNGATKELVADIEQILLDNPELQDVYWSWMDVHTVLGVERSAVLGEHREPRDSGLNDQTSARPGRLARNARSRRRTLIVGSSLALATCLMLGLFAFQSPLSLTVDDGVDKLRMACQPGAESAWSIPDITYVSWDGPVFADRSTVHPSASRPRVGSVGLALASGRSADGYVLCLDPGETAEMMLAIDAIAENNCSVIEIDSQGTPLRRVVSFNNFQPDIDPKTRRCGLAGTWVEKNNTDKSQYYLINGIHKRYHPSSRTADRLQSFHLSDMRVILDEPDLVVIGWDDGGLDVSEFHGAIRSDHSFDDLTVVIRLSGPGIQASPPTASHRIRGWTSPRMHAQAIKGPHTEGFERYRFSVQPGEMVVLNVGSEAKVLNSLYLIDEGSEAVLWSVDNAGLQSNHLGAVVVENSGIEKITLAVFGECLPPSDNGEVEMRSEDWTCSELLKVYGQPNCAILGFRDRVRKGEFVDLRVTLMTVSPHLSGLFDERQAK